PVLAGPGRQRAAHHRGRRRGRGDVHPGRRGARRRVGRQERAGRAGPLSQDPGVGQRNWETSGIAGLLSEAGMTNMEFVLRFTLSHRGLSTTIVGTSNPVHLASNIAIAEKGPLPADLYEEAKKRLPLP